MSKTKVKVLIVDDSLLFRASISKLLDGNPNVEVVGAAEDAFEAGEMITDLSPDVLVLDINMPKMDGRQFLSQLMNECPITVIMVSENDADEQELLSAGAAGFMKKPKSPNDMRTFSSLLITKIIIAVGNKNFSIKKNIPAEQIIRPLPPAVSPVLQMPVSQKTFGRVIPNMPSTDDISGVALKAKDGFVVALGASTGGTDALECVLQSFPANMPPVLVVQHMPPVFTKMYAERLNKICAMEIKEAQDGDRLTPGVCLIAAGGLHLELKKDTQGYYAKCYHGEKVSGHCPSVDVMFSSVASVAGKKSVGAILTGMGADGAKGLLKMRENGAYTVGQDKESCVVYGMPMEAYKLGACSEQQPLSNVGATLCKVLARGWKN